MVESVRPLSERVSAPFELVLPEHSDVALWRAATLQDIDQIWHLMQAMGRVDHPNYLATREEVADDFGFTFFDPAVDSLLGFSADGLLLAVGFVTLSPGQRTLVKSTVAGGVHPEWRARGIGRVLLEWQLGRARQQLASSQATLPGWIQSYADERAPQCHRLLERAGLTVARYFVELERVLADPIRDFELAGGIRLAPYAPDMSAAVHTAHDEAFADHWSSQPLSDETWNSFIAAETFRPDLSFVVYGTDADGHEHVAGYLLSTVSEDDWEGAGFSSSYIALVGVLREWRGRHIAQALLAAHLEASRAAGHQRATLDVDTDSPTGAVGLYTGMGFAAAHRELVFTVEF
ncbi:hypothetical protein GY21_01110 [Cryobacterium roopkundense]|uniref:Ribosomal protein S18 acetylase RimI-like enzyme n=1 Tax=Cryobacterium roopkundense TaxID=1001240 RepID=A0A099JYB9_9MICO|nr:GNAT family N-acetyltransferase [Cryobacterium roopkundense]KGJ82398.1 hypothetical protein GY21_01110 [Cryobacterium roopkundense]MBB5639564.1 ribosomal protein S18 acetylase RimI-like enzyme [Cryobacterium roopkundense]